MLIKGTDCSKGFRDFLQEPNDMMERARVLEIETHLCDLEYLSKPISLWQNGAAGTFSQGVCSD